MNKKFILENKLHSGNFCSESQRTPRSRALLECWNCKKKIWIKSWKNFSFSLFHFRRFQRNDQSMLTYVQFTKLFWHKKLHFYTLARFDLTTRNFASRDVVTRPRHQVLNLQDVWFGRRVTRLGEFSPKRTIFYFSQIYESCRSITNFWTTFPLSLDYALILTKNELGNILDDFFPQTHLVTLFGRTLVKFVACLLL
jgi:hypothetical protein